MYYAALASSPGEGRMYFCDCESGWRNRIDAAACRSLIASEANQSRLPPRTDIGSSQGLLQ